MPYMKSYDAKRAKPKEQILSPDEINSLMTEMRKQQKHESSSIPDSQATTEDGVRRK